MDAAHLLDVGGAAEPSFFELASQRSMANVLAPALRYLATVVTSWRPRLLGPLLGYVDEVSPRCPTALLPLPHTLSAGSPTTPHASCHSPFWVARC